MTMTEGPDFRGLGRSNASGPSHASGRAGRVRHSSRRDFPRVGAPRGRPAYQRRRRRGLRLVATALAALAVASGTAYTIHRDRGHQHVSPKPQAVGTGHGNLVPALTRYQDECLDKSGSVDRDGRLATRATDLLISRLPSINPTKPTAPVDGIDLTVRVVRMNSYSTVTDTEYIVQAVIPSIPGLRDARPSTPADGANWDADDATVEAAQVNAKDAQTSISTKLKHLTALTSDGSDIDGCVAADLQTRGADTPVRLWIVSDLQQISPKGLGGKPQSYKGRFSKADVVISQACPDGSQAACDSRLAAFKTQLANLGISDDRITVLPSDSLDNAYAAWIGTNG
jgi:hypothetical protein